MAFGNNRKGEQPRAHFRQAGGSIIKFRHPYLAGQIDSNNETLDEIDISSSCKLEGRFFEANPNQDSAKQVVLVDGSTVTITNKLLNGTIQMPVIRTTGLVGTGDFISALHLIKSVGDSVGGLLYKTDFINGKAITRLYYGVTVQRVPDDISEGNDVAVYPVQLLYAGWIEAQSDSVAENKKTIWAVGNAKGLSAYFAPYSVQNTSGNGGTKESPLSTGNSGLIGSSIADNTSSNQIANSDEVTSATAKDSKYGAIISDGSSVNA